jgi:hypothetical protein
MVLLQPKHRQSGKRKRLIHSRSLTREAHGAQTWAKPADLVSVCYLKRWPPNLKHTEIAIYFHRPCRSTGVWLFEAGPVEKLGFGLWYTGWLCPTWLPSFLDGDHHDMFLSWQRQTQMARWKHSPSGGLGLILHILSLSTCHGWNRLLWSVYYRTLWVLTALTES